LFTQYREIIEILCKKREYSEKIAMDIVFGIRQPEEIRDTHIRTYIFTIFDLSSFRQSDDLFSFSAS